jgi:hypothetical protein
VVATRQPGDIPVWLNPSASAPNWIRPDNTTPDRNQMTCTIYDALNRPHYVRTACRPPASLYDSYGSGVTQWNTYPEYLAALKAAVFQDYLQEGSNLYNLVMRTFYDPLGRQIAAVRNYEDLMETVYLSSPASATSSPAPL